MSSGSCVPSSLCPSYCIEPMLDCCWVFASSLGFGLWPASWWSSLALALFGWTKIFTSGAMCIPVEFWLGLPWLSLCLGGPDPHLVPPQTVMLYCNSQQWSMIVAAAKLVVCFMWNFKTFVSFRATTFIVSVFFSLVSALVNFTC